jgi:hypothetical protein
MELGQDNTRHERVLSVEVGGAAKRQLGPSGKILSADYRRSFPSRFKSAISVENRLRSAPVISNASHWSTRPANTPRGMRLNPASSAVAAPLVTAV